MPSSIPYIVGNEAAERFSFYGMKAIMMTYMTTALLMPKAEAAYFGHLFNFAVYLLPFFGALLADMYWGKYNVVFKLSLVYCLGHLVLALPDNFLGCNSRYLFFLGLFLIALGAGGIKSCVSAIVGDQFNKSNQSLLSKVFGWFYLSINIGSFVSMLLIPYLKEKYGFHLAFGVPGIFMAIATLIFWLGRKKYILVPPVKTGYFKKVFGTEGIACIKKISILFSFLILFWAVYDQNTYRWVDQAKGMDMHLFSSCTFLPDSITQHSILIEQVQAVNPILVLMFIPLFSYVIYPFIDRFYTFTLVRRIQWGLILGIIASVIPLWIEYQTVRGITLNITWQILAYVLITASEVLISVSALELAYTQAPLSMKSLIMSFYLLPIAFGNLFAAEINQLCGKYPLIFANEKYYAFFSIALLINTILFFFYARNFKEEVILPDSDMTEEIK